MDSNTVPPKCQFSCLTLKRLDGGSPSPHFRRPWPSQQSGERCCLLMLALQVEHIECEEPHGPCGFHQYLEHVVCFVLAELAFKGHSSWFSFENAIFSFLSPLEGIFFHYSEVSGRVLRQAMTNFNRRNRETLKENTLKPNAGYNIYIYIFPLSAIISYISFNLSNLRAGFD